MILTTRNRLYVAGAGGKLLYRNDADSISAAQESVFFRGADADNVSPSLYNWNVIINTPLTAGNAGNIYFGFIVNAANPANLVRSIARVGADGRGAQVGTAAAAGDATIQKVATNSAPALSLDGRTVYVAVNTPEIPIWSSGYLLALGSSTLATRSKVRLTDPNTNTAAWINDNGTASPTVGPDGDVYVGVLESNPPSHNFTGRMAALRRHACSGQDARRVRLGQHRLGRSARDGAWLQRKFKLPVADQIQQLRWRRHWRRHESHCDPRPESNADQSQNGVPVMEEVLTMLGATVDPIYPGGVMQWFINTAAVNSFTKSVLVNSEDGYLYRRDLSVNQFTERIRLNGGTAQPCAPTAIGPNGAVYSINSAVLFSMER